MKKHLYHYTTCLTLLLCMLMSTAFAATPLEGGIQPRYTEIRKFVSSLDITETGYAECSSEISVFDSSFEIDLTISLQRSSNGRTWSTVKSWDTSDFGSATLDEGWFVSSGYSYRVKATAEVYDASGDFVESDSVTSQITDY